MLSLKSESDVLREVADSLRAHRLALGWRQEDLAKAADVAPATIYRLEKGAGPLMGYVSTLMRIQSAFESAGIRFFDSDAGGGIRVRLSEQKA